MSIEKKNDKFRVRVLKKGKHYSKTFPTLEEAEKWEKEITGGEAKRHHSVPPKPKKEHILTFGEVLEAFATHIRETNRPAYIRATYYSKQEIGKIPVSELCAKHFNKMFEERIKAISSASVKRDRTTLSTACNYAVKQGMMKFNPVRESEKYKDAPHRERVATVEEIEELIQAVKWDKISPPTTMLQRVIIAFVFSTLTGMRIGEICALKWSWISSKSLILPASVTKTRKGRNVGLTKEARRLISLMPKEGDQVFQLDRDIASTLFRKVRDKCGMRPEYDSDGNVIKEALRFHDGRATFCTNAAKKLDPMALARQLGHTDTKMTMRYYRQSADVIADMLEE